MNVAYLDASAAVKLLVAEEESASLVAALDGVLLLSSELLDVELRCVAQRAGVPAERVDELVRRVGLVPFDAAIRARAGAPFDPPQRALDAVHLATALGLPGERPTLVSYDREQLAAARAVGLPCSSPC